MASARSRANVAFARRDQSLSKRVAVKAAELFQVEETAGVPLIVAAVIALLWANSPGSDSYDQFWSTRLLVHMDTTVFAFDLRHGINDLLMPVFFFIVGLELKYALTEGELSTWRRAAMPVIIGLGGMAVPAAIYVGINLIGGGALKGWAIPVATDIAFVLAILVLLGDRVPAALRVLALAIAAVDDVGGVLAIAFFYSRNLELIALTVAVGFLLLVLGASRIGVRSTVLYVLLGVAALIATYSSGVHTTIAGVLLGLLVSAKPAFSRDDFVSHSRRLLEEFHEVHKSRTELETNDDRSERECSELEASLEQEEELLGKIDALADGTEAPVRRAMRVTNPWVSFVILPIFALANAGITFSTEALTGALSSWIAWGVFVGLFLGKPVGILLAAWAAERWKLAEMPTDVDWRGMIGLAFLAGIGFTVSLFIAELAFSGGRELEQSKIAILGATIGAIVIGVIVLWGRESADHND